MRTSPDWRAGESRCGKATMKARKAVFKGGMLQIQKMKNYS